MSTTGGGEQGTVFVLDEPQAIERKFKGAVTDSGSEVRRAPEKPGISNLIEILAAVRGAPAAQVEADFSEARYGEFKTAVAGAVIDYLTPVREGYERLRGDEAQLERTFQAGAARASTIAAATLADVRERMGVGAPRRERSLP
jgi:tryptophanyl-tRNA synthetase